MGQNKLKKEEWAFFSVVSARNQIFKICPQKKEGIVGSVVECSPATRAARVQFPDDAKYFWPEINYNHFAMKLQ